jgi:hypothetical protein
VAFRTRYRPTNEQLGRQRYCDRWTRLVRLVRQDQVRGLGLWAGGGVTYYAFGGSAQRLGSRSSTARRAATARLTSAFEQPVWRVVSSNTSSCDLGPATRRRFTKSTISGFTFDATMRVTATRRVWVSRPARACACNRRVWRCRVARHRRAASCASGLLARNQLARPSHRRLVPHGGGSGTRFGTGEPVRLKEGEPIRGKSIPDSEGDAMRQSPHRRRRLRRGPRCRVRASSALRAHAWARLGSHP